MIIQKERELQQIAFNHSLDIDFRDFMNLYKQMYWKTIYYSFIR